MAVITSYFTQNVSFRSRLRQFHRSQIHTVCQRILPKPRLPGLRLQRTTRVISAVAELFYILIINLEMRHMPTADNFRKKNSQ